MNIDGNAIRNIMRIVSGKYVLNRSDADALGKLLGSREEFLAWIFLRNKYSELHPEVGHILAEVAASTVATPASRSKESGYPVFEQQDRLAMESAMRSVIEASETSQHVNEVDTALISFASRNGSDALIGHTLKIKTLSGGHIDG